MHIRDYRPEDDPALMILERLSPRGCRAVVHYRQRFIDRAALSPSITYWSLKTMAGDGCVAAGLKQTHVGGRAVRLAMSSTRARIRPGDGGRGVGAGHRPRRLAAGAQPMASTGMSSPRAWPRCTCSPCGYQQLRRLIMLTFNRFRR